MGGPIMKTKARWALTDEGRLKMEEAYAQSRFPPTAVRERLCREVDGTMRQIQVWFQNRRQRDQRQNEAWPAVPVVFMNNPNMPGGYYTPSADGASLTAMSLPPGMQGGGQSPMMCMPSNGMYMAGGMMPGCGCYPSSYPGGQPAMSMPGGGAQMSSAPMQAYAPQQQQQLSPHQMMMPQQMVAPQMQPGMQPQMQMQQPAAAQQQVAPPMPAQHAQVAQQAQMVASAATTAPPAAANGAALAPQAALMHSGAAAGATGSDAPADGAAGGVPTSLSGMPGMTVSSGGAAMAFMGQQPEGGVPASSAAATNEGLQAHWLESQHSIGARSRRRHTTAHSLAAASPPCASTPPTPLASPHPPLAIPHSPHRLNLCVHSPSFAPSSRLVHSQRCRPRLRPPRARRCRQRAWPDGAACRGECRRRRHRPRRLRKGRRLRRRTIHTLNWRHHPLLSGILHTRRHGSRAIRQPRGE